MGKKGNWFSALKRAFTSSSKDNSISSSENKYARENKKWGLGKSKHGESNSFIPLYREPSSIEKILGDAERDLQYQRNYQEPPKKVQHLKYSTNQETAKKVQHSQPPNQGPSKRVQHVKPALKPQPKPGVGSNKRAITASYAQISAIRIQAAYRGYLARKNYRALKGLVRLQRVMRGQSVKRQTTNTMKCMQLLVRVQSQVRARRLQMIESKNHQHHQTPGRSEKEMDNFSRWNVVPQSQAEGGDEWNDSVLTKEERDDRTRRKVEAVIKRERALAYAYSHQLLKVTPKSAHAVLTDIRSGSFPWWWSWLDRQLPHETHPTPLPKTPILLTPRFTNFTSNASQFRPNTYYPSKRDISEAPTPRSSKAVPSPRTKNPLKSSNNWNQNQLKDDESLTSCPAFRVVPNYMAPTVSAKAKVRDNLRTMHDGHDGGKKRFLFSLNQSIASLRWSKGPLFTGNEAKGKHRSTNSIGGMSMDSTVSLPVGVGRKPFK